MQQQKANHQQNRDSLKSRMSEKLPYIVVCDSCGSIDAYMLTRGRVLYTENEKANT